MEVLESGDSFLIRHSIGDTRQTICAGHPVQIVRQRSSQIYLYCPQSNVWSKKRRWVTLNWVCLCVRRKRIIKIRNLCGEFKGFCSDGKKRINSCQDGKRIGQIANRWTSPRVYWKESWVLLQTLTRKFPNSTHNISIYSLRLPPWNHLRRALKVSAWRKIYHDNGSILVFWYWI